MRLRAACARGRPARVDESEQKPTEGRLYYRCPGSRTTDPLFRCCRDRKPSRSKSRNLRRAQLNPQGCRRSRLQLDALPPSRLNLARPSRGCEPDVLPTRNVATEGSAAMRSNRCTRCLHAPPESYQSPRLPVCPAVSHDDTPPFAGKGTL